MSDDTELSDLHDVFQQVLGWGGDLGYSFRIQGKTFNSFRGRTRSSRCESFACIADDRELVCPSGRGAAPPESCDGPRGYRLMLKRQQQGASVSDPTLVEATIQLLSATHPEQPASTWNLLRDAVREGWQSAGR